MEPEISSPPEGEKPLLGVLINDALARHRSQTTFIDDETKKVWAYTCFHACEDAIKHSGKTLIVYYHN